jgi:hypothetical protein
LRHRCSDSFVKSCKIFPYRLLFGYWWNGILRNWILFGLWQVLRRCYAQFCFYLYNCVCTLDTYPRITHYNKPAYQNQDDDCYQRIYPCFVFHIYSLNTTIPDISRNSSICRFDLFREHSVRGINTIALHLIAYNPTPNNFVISLLRYS